MAEALASVAVDGKHANPLRAGLQSDRVTDPCTIVFFGASGDLFKRMLLPAVYALRLKGVLPNDFAIVGFSRSDYTDESFRQYCKEQLDQFAPDDEKPQGAMWDDFAKRISYMSADFNDVKCYEALAKHLKENDEQLGTKGNRLFYLSTPPSVFPLIIDQLKTAGLDPRGDDLGWSRIIVEKPFGTDLQSARALQQTVDRVFRENEVYRIDHYLGKEPVQDIMALRFANTIFEPVWNRNYVQSIQITASEQLGVEARGGYYEGAGALRDMIQNHVMNLLALVAMEPPATSEADAIRSEKFKVFSAIVPPTHADVVNMAVRGQYGPGTINGEAVQGYRQEPDVSPTSNTETYAALRLFVESWRWAGVPFYLRSGKRLAKKMSEIAVTFKPIPHRLYGDASDTIEPNALVIKIQPDEGVAMRFSAKVPGQKNHIRSVFMDFNYGTGFGVQSPPAYERLITDAMRGDQTLFTRWDAVERAWEVISPVLDVWQNTKDFAFPNYASGSQGPDAAMKLFPDWRPL
ncbi:MAG TPA: glucose-6-phosphate dehydrogenase [Candidatus Baltobacteraceae bacterium]|jgi:glucose-6-phosphate 1-dehydrogenase|nr:glucose-6-phosphate dehydrogenase [Candidatus Baltobacteraceae bacterium]